MRKIIVLLLSVFFVFSCASGPSMETAPEWVLSPSALYSDEEFLSAVGQGDSRESAEMAATAGLTRIIRQNVQAETTSSESFNQEEEGWDNSKSISTSVKAFSDVEISGIYIQDVWVAGSSKEPVYYALALVNREETGNLYKSKVNELSGVINSKIEDAYKNMGTFTAYSLLKDGALLAEECDYYLDILAVVNPDFYSVSKPDYVNAAAVKELSRRALDKIIVDISIEGDVDGRIAAAFGKIFQAYGIKLSNEEQDSTYILKGDVSISPMDMTSKTENVFVRFVLNTELTEVNTGKAVLAFAQSGREAHLSESEAAQRAVRTMENIISQDYKEKIAGLF